MNTNSLTYNTFYKCKGVQRPNVWDPLNKVIKLSPFYKERSWGSGRQSDFSSITQPVDGKRWFQSPCSSPLHSAFWFDFQASLQQMQESCFAAFKGLSLPLSALIIATAWKGWNYLHSFWIDRDTEAQRGVMCLPKAPLRGRELGFEPGWSDYRICLLQDILWWLNGRTIRTGLRAITCWKHVVSGHPVLFIWNVLDNWSQVVLNNWSQVGLEILYTGKF